MHKLFEVIVCSKNHPPKKFNCVATDLHGGASKAVKYCRKFFADETITIRDVTEIKFVSNMSEAKVIT